MGLMQSRESKLLDDFLSGIEGRFREIENQLTTLKGDVGAKHVKLTTDNVSNPPTDAELDALYGTPASVGAGFITLIDDNGAGTNFYLVASSGSAWWVFTGVVAA